MRRLTVSILALSLSASMAFAGSNKADKPTSVKPAASTGGFDINALDKTADPCVDFYQFTCGGWRAKNPLPDDKSRWGRYDEMAERNREKLRTLLEEAATGSSTRTQLARQVGDYYAACIDEPAANRKGVAPIGP